MRAWPSLFTPIFLTVICLSACKKDEAPPVSITGTVRDANGAPIAGVLIKAIHQPSNFETVTDQSGNYELSDLPYSDYYVVNASKSGYLGNTRTVKFDKGENTIQADFILTGIQIFLSLNQKTFLLDNNAQDLAITVQANIDWTITGNIPWVQYNPKSGQGNGSIIISIQANSGATTRTAELTVTGSGVAPQTISITQGTSLMLIDHTGLHENQDPSDSIFLIFNKPVTVNNISSIEPNYLLDNVFSYMPGNTGFKFYCPYAALCNEYGFKFSVTGPDNKEMNGIIYVTYYDRRIALPGTISPFILTPDNKTVWACTYDPSRLVKVDVETAEVKQVYNLPDNIFQIFLNEYNNLLYLVPPSKNYISVYNPENGLHIKNIQFSPDSIDNQTYPSIYPLSVAFGKNGYGIVVLREVSGGLSRFKVIDSANDDALSIYYPIPGTESRPGLTSVSYDGKKILMRDAYDAPRIQILDTETHELSDQELLLAGLMSSIRPSRINNKLFVGGLYTQFLFDLETKNQVGATSYLSLLDQESADFTYNPSNDTEVYCMIPFKKQFEVLDYSQGMTLYSCATPQNLRNLTATTDRKRIIVARENELFFINSDTFK